MICLCKVVKFGDVKIEQIYWERGIELIFSIIMCPINFYVLLKQIYEDRLIELIVSIVLSHN